MWGKPLTAVEMRILDHKKESPKVVLLALFTKSQDQEEEAAHAEYFASCFRRWASFRLLLLMFSGLYILTFKNLELRSNWNPTWRGVTTAHSLWVVADVLLTTGLESIILVWFWVGVWGSRLPLPALSRGNLTICLSTIHPTHYPSIICHPPYSPHHLFWLNQITDLTRPKCRV